MSKAFNFIVAAAFAAAALAAAVNLAGVEENSAMSARLCADIACGAVFF